MLFKKSSNSQNNIPWNKLTSISQLDDIDVVSKDTPVAIFKHSTRCSISSSALNRLERNWQEETSEKLSPYYLDLISHRDVSNEISNKYGVMHESPQVIIIKDGKAIYHNSHMGINYQDIINQI